MKKAVERNAQNPILWNLKKKESVEAKLYAYQFKENLKNIGTWSDIFLASFKSAKLL